MLEPELEARLLRIVRAWRATGQGLHRRRSRRSRSSSNSPATTFPLAIGGSSRGWPGAGARYPMLRGFTAASVLAAYRSGSVDLGQTQFLIGRVPDALFPLDVHGGGRSPRGRVRRPRAVVGFELLRRECEQVLDRLQPATNVWAHSRLATSTEGKLVRRL